VGWSQKPLAKNPKPIVIPPGIWKVFHAVSQAFHRLKDWECWPVIRDHYAGKGMDEDALYKHIKGILEERHVRWGRAV
jgi:hypothetical protein